MNDLIEIPRVTLDDIQNHLESVGKTISSLKKPKPIHSVSTVQISPDFTFTLEDNSL